MPEGEQLSFYVGCTLSLLLAFFCALYLIIRGGD